MATIEQLYAMVSEMSVSDIEEKIAAHQIKIKILRKVLLMIEEEEMGRSLSAGCETADEEETHGREKI